MKKFTRFVLILTVAFAFPLASFAQEKTICISHEMYEQENANDPSIAAARQQLEMETAAFVNNPAAQKSSGVVKIIPVVFHVIHEGGVENISKAQIESQIAAMNLDYRRLNTDTANTPAPFKPLSADCEIEFRLAQIDPNGNCTDGITRTFSHLTTDARNNVKALIIWPPNKYLNIWVVKSIENTSGAAGIIIGFAQFPGGSPSTDGIVMRSNYTGTIGTAASSGNAGRACAHEAGHFFNLRHIWGDATCGDDLVADTPTQNVNQSNCPAFPKIDAACNNGPNGAMFTNYMDYTLGTCMNMFSNGQSSRMQAALNSAVSGRNNLWSAANLAATGTDGSPTPLCAPKADFSPDPKFICAGGSITFTDWSWNGTVSNWDWQFPGGTPANSNSQNPVITYNTPGVYDVTLTVSNASGSDSKTVTGAVVVSDLTAAINSYPFTEGFETGVFPLNDWYILNSYPNSSGWEETSLASHSGSKAARIYNYSNNGNVNSIDALITTSYNFTNMSSVKMTFWRSYALQTNNTPADYLKIYSSTSCANTWNIRYNKAAAALANAGVITTPFIPNASQWVSDTVNLASSAVSGQPNVRFKFEYFQDQGNNIYLDDINIDGVTGIHEPANAPVEFSVYPNPAKAIKARIYFSLDQRANAQLKLLDVTGRMVKIMDARNFEPGEYVYEVDEETAPGVYAVCLTIGNNLSVKKLVIQ